MKKLSILALAAVGLLFGACSSNDDVAEEKSLDFKGKTEGFFKINLNLPTTPVVSTRAWQESANLNDGLPTEYAVQKVLLLIFEGPNEAGATLKQLIDLGGWTAGLHSDTPEQITTRQEFIAKLSSAPSNNLYALAVVNPGNVISQSTDVNKVNVKGTVLTAPDLATIKTVLAASADATTNDFVYTSSSDKFIFMTNAVLSNTIGGTTQPSTVTPQTLAPVDASFIYDTEAKASAGSPATDIYVERGVAKVTLNNTADVDFLKTSALTPSTGITLDATLSGWGLTNTNKSSYIIRQVPTSFTWDLKTKSTAVTVDPYRFVGGNPVDPAVALYRTYWAEDPNYDVAHSPSNFSKASTFTNTAVGDANPLYCFENTFTVPYQTVQNTTCAVVAVKLTTGTDPFYVVGADRKTLYTEGNVKDKVVSYILSQPAFNSWFTDPDAMEGGQGTLLGSTVTVEFDKTGAGKLSVKSVTIPAANVKAGAALKIDNSTTTVDGHDLSGVIGTLNTQLSNVERFAGGVAYYTIRIKHFGDDLTPWNNGEYDTSDPSYAPKESDIASIYPQGSDTRQEANYLGRYGVVRNNWYDLQIGEILKIGSSTVPEIEATTHPDDDLEDLYIKARINILSWAKRSQSWDLK